MKTFDPDYPVIVVGDFNIEPGMPGALRRVAEALQ
jgi:endonuclease/exonuclease/phosphatase family metal-dependent hydrolase